MSSSDAIVAQAAFDVLRLGRSAQFIVALLLRFWDSKNIKKHDVVGKIHFVQGSDLKDAQVMTRVVVYFVIEPRLFCRLRIVEVLKHNNWYYVSCTGCSRKLDKSDQSPHCNRCVNLNATGVVK
ncbi:unnamed protein product [Brassica rapa]|uniref:Replication factor A C-terminal domain-containing protein n=1 Tax=Brassica campestris TaxID=3711 RepID=A0A3P6AYX8_BRACM|nr:unnamed protein product [Brassica rapa]CAG7902001.1 unnamed protein product [Brassica rapa]VDC97822.1 unnamed protein product [Brassica rapa]